MSSLAKHTRSGHKIPSINKAEINVSNLRVTFYPERSFLLMEQGFKQAMNNFSLEIGQNFLQPEE